jgi:hypothetical protein
LHKWLLALPAMWPEQWLKQIQMVPLIWPLLLQKMFLALPVLWLAQLPKLIQPWLLKLPAQ